ncbi:MAG: UDP-N-acetylmuramoyl-L-alanine--D-glutamate ligase [Chthoniobacterales bacterium]
MNLADKNTLVFGIGHSGRAAARLLMHEGATVTIWDSAPREKIKDVIEIVTDQGIACLTGDAWEKDNAPYDLAILSPGIEPTAKEVRKVTDKGTPLLAEIELASRINHAPIAAITGTNGKTTTTLLLEALLRAANIRSTACGNIGKPFSEVVLATPRDQIITLEVSSFQLETIQDFHPKVAVWTNFSANHLDRYNSIEEYRQAKERIFINQTSSDFAIVNAHGPIPETKAQVLTFAADSSNADLSFSGNAIHFQGRSIAEVKNPRLLGFHNRENLLAALGACIGLGIEPADLIPSLDQFSPPEHRCEHVGTFMGVNVINDSKSTNSDATEKAIRSFDSPIILILGGKNKGFDFSPLTALIRKRVKHTIALGEMRSSISETLEHHDCSEADSLEHAIELARKLTVTGDTLLFSPGTSSFDMFANYEARGKAFKKLIPKFFSH